MTSRRRFLCATGATATAAALSALGLPSGALAAQGIETSAPQPDRKSVV